MVQHVPRPLTQPVETLASSFFLSKYILGSSFAYLASFYNSYPDREEISATIEAVGLASLSNELESFQLSERARKRYVHAIQATNTALQDSARVKKDSTLLAVLLLTLYEIMTCTTHSAMCLWEGHVKGAEALIRLRGHQQMQRQLGLQLLHQATASVIISSHKNKSEVPKDTISLVAHGLQYANNDDPSWQFRLISIRSANLRAAIEKGSLRDLDVIVAAVTKLDDDFVAWSRTLPPSWQYEVHYVEQADTTLVYEGCYHIYPTYGIAQSLNGWRVCRMTLNETILDQVSRHHTSPIHSQDHARLISHIESIITGLCSEICASVPQYVELPTAPPLSVTVCRMQSPAPTTCDPSSHMEKSSGSGFTQTSRSYGIIGPLMSVANCVIPNTSRRAWAINRLQAVSRHTKNPQARLALELLEGKIHPKIRYFSVSTESGLCIGLTC